MSTDAITSTIQVALDGLADRQRVTDNNIANLQTPGFLAQKTDFETSLQSALDGNNVSTTPTHTTSLAPTLTNGNNVDIDNETVSATDTNMRYQAMIDAMNTKFRTLRSAIG